MAESAFQMFGLSTDTVQQSGNFLLYVLVGLILVGLLGFIIYKIVQNAQYKFRVTIYEEVGDQTIKVEDMARIIKIEDAEMLHYKHTKLHSPRFHPKYFQINKFWAGMGVKVAQSLTILKKGDKMVPLIIHPMSGVQAYDYDAWNYLVQRLRINQAKYEKNQQLMRILPFIALGAVVLMFILGNLFWGMHVEKVATNILAAATEIAKGVMEKSGAVQII